MKKRFLFVLMILIALQGMAQRLPNWVINKPAPTNSTYLYVVESGIGQTELQARNLAIAEVFRTTAMNLGMRFDFEEISRALQEGVEYKTISTTYDIPINKVCEYPEKQNNGYKVYVLCQVAKTGEYSPTFDDFNACYEGNNKYYANEALYADGCYVYKNGNKLSDSEVRTMFANSRSYDLYDRGMKLGYDNSALYGFGGGMIALGAVFQLGWLDDGWEDPSGRGLVITGAVFGGLGVGLIITGTVCSSVGKAKIRQAVNLYNNGRMYSQRSLDMEYGLTGNGVFLSFSF